jgi:hypothetical protein
VGETDGADIRIWFFEVWIVRPAVRVGRVFAGTKHLTFGLEFDMDFHSDNGLVFWHTSIK